MPFSPSLSLFQKNNARNIIYMAVLIYLKCLDLRKNVYSRTTSQSQSEQKNNVKKDNSIFLQNAQPLAHINSMRVREA
jgi:hypothetical protein